MKKAPATSYPSDIAFTRTVKAIQSRKGSRPGYASMEEHGSWETRGADWLERFKRYIEDGRTIVVAPHRVWGPETNDLVLQLRKRRISKIILSGMLANMCVESHLGELSEQGFEVAVVKDATAAPRHPE